MVNCTSKLKLSKSTVSWSNSVVGIGTATLRASTAVPVRFLLENISALFYTRFSIDIVHAVSYSLLLLNTDLHIAELAAHMSKSQFVRNTITAIQMQLQPNSSEQVLTSDHIRDDGSSLRGGGSDETEIPHSKRSDSVASWNSLPHEAALLTTISASAPNGAALEENGPTGSSHFVNGREQNISRQRGRAWESDMESLLKVCLVSFFCDYDLTCNFIGNVQCYQESTDTATYQLKHGSFFHVLAEPWWQWHVEE